MAKNAQGLCDPKFKRVKQLFEEHFDPASKSRAALLAHRRQLVLDSLRSNADKAQNPPVESRQTLVNVLNSSQRKGHHRIARIRLVIRASLNLEAPVAKYWPEFAQAGKDKIPVKFLLSHRAGVPAIANNCRPTLLELVPDVRRTRARATVVDAAHQARYHAITFGYLVGEVIRRITGKDPRHLPARRNRESAQLDIHIGSIRASIRRIADLVDAPPPPPNAPPIR